MLLSERASKGGGAPGMSSTLNLAAKGSQFVIQGAKGLSRNVHARTRQPTVPGIPRESRPRNAGPRGQQIPPRVEGSEKQDLLTLGLCLLSISTPFTQPLPRSFFFPWRPSLLCLPRAPGIDIMASPHPPRQALLGTGDSPTKCRSPLLLSVSPVSRGFFSLSPWKSRPEIW